MLSVCDNHIMNNHFIQYRSTSDVSIGLTYAVDDPADNSKLNLYYDRFLPSLFNLEVTFLVKRGINLIKNSFVQERKKETYNVCSLFFA